MPTVSKYNQNKDHYDFKVEHYRKQGLNDKQIAHNLGIGLTTMKEWRRKYTSFASAYKKGKALIIEKLENAIYKKALGYEFEEVTTEIRDDGKSKQKHIKKVAKHIPPDPTALIFLLTNLDNEKYKRNPDLTNKEEEQEGFGESKFVD